MLITNNFGRSRIIKSHIAKNDLILTRERLSIPCTALLRAEFGIE